MNERNPEPIFPPADNEPSDANPVPLSPTNPTHRTEESDSAAGTRAQPVAPIPVAAPGSSTGTPLAVPVEPTTATPDGGKPASDDRG